MEARKKSNAQLFLGMATGAVILLGVWLAWNGFFGAWYIMGNMRP